MSSVRRLQSPIPVETRQTGFGQPRTFQVAFAQSLSVFANEGAQSSSEPLPSGAVPANARVTSPSAEQQPRHPQQAPDWNGHDRLPDDDMEAQVRREMDEWQKSLYKQNRFLFKIAADEWNDKRLEIRRRLWAERNRRRGFD